VNLLLIGGLSGSGKSVALGALEDSGYYAVNNLPPAQIVSLAHYLRESRQERIAIALDLRTRAALDALPGAISALRAEGWNVHFLYLDAKTETLVKRFSETRRKHPLSTEQRTLHEAIDLERRMLSDVSSLGYHFDTSDLPAHALRAWIKDFVKTDTSGFTLLFQSFGYKHGVPLDADLVFDVRCLPNPHYEANLAPLTGCDRPVIDYFNLYPEVEQMYGDIRDFVAKWLKAYGRDNRNYLTVALGCTGGRHRSVYLVERLAQEFGGKVAVLKRHRELD
jgi:UPF0042 nucleotide-binding protein